MQFLADTAITGFVQSISIFVIVIIALGLLMKRLHQPYIIAYILVGVFLGDHGLGLIQEEETIAHLGEIGIILLMFFIGMEISLPEFLASWRVALIGTSLQVMLSVGAILGLGFAMGWGLNRSIVLGFVIALSSSAVIIKLLEEKNLMKTTIGRNVLSILLTQDILIVPLLIITAFLGGGETSSLEVVKMLIGGTLIVITLVYLYRHQEVKIPLSRTIAGDYELQVFAALFFCFGGALITALFGLSPALGAFVGGMVMHNANACTWIHHTLHPFRTLFVALFFISVGLQIDLGFIRENIGAIFLVLLMVYLTNHVLNAVILKIFGCPWRDSFVGGALLAQIGELSFLISLSAFSMGIIEEFTYKFTISLISLTLIVSPFWILGSERLLKWKHDRDIGRNPVPGGLSS